MDLVALSRRGRRGERTRHLLVCAGDTLESRQVIGGETGRPVGWDGRRRRECVVRVVSPHTVRNHSTNLRRKLDVRSWLEAVIAAVRMGVLTFDKDQRETDGPETLGFRPASWSKPDVPFFGGGRSRSLSETVALRQPSDGTLFSCARLVCRGHRELGGSIYCELRTSGNTRRFRYSGFARSASEADQCRDGIRFLALAAPTGMCGLPMAPQSRPGRRPRNASQRLPTAGFSALSNGSPSTLGWQVEVPNRRRC